MAVDMFLKFTPDIKGDSQDHAHTDEIEVLSWNWGADQSGTMHRGTGGGAGKVSVHDVTIVKYHDKSTPNLWQLCCNGKHSDEALLTVRKAGGDAQLEYLKITFTKVLISSMQTGGSAGEETPTETVTLNFAEFKMEYTPQDDKGAAGAALNAGWNIREGVPV